MRRATRAAALAGWLLLLPGIAQAAEIEIQILAPAAGQRVGSAVTVEAQTAGPATAVTFDASTDGGGTWTPIGSDGEPSDGWTATWDASGVNGPATIRATATDGAASVSASVDVIVDTTPPGVVIRLTNTAFSPNADGRADRTGIELALTEDAALTLRIDGRAGAVRLLREAEPALAGPSKVRWRGQTDGGGMAPDGRYVVHADAVDAVGNSSTARAVVQVDTRAPTFAWRSIAPEPYRGEGDVRFAFQIRDRAPTLLVRGRITDARSRAIATLPPVSATSGERRLSWDGATKGGRPTDPGLRHIEVTVRDDAGNIAMPPPEPFRDHRPVVAEILRRVEGASGRIALTFDDCYDASSWARILQVLHGRHAQASFFCLGPYVRAYPALAQRTVADGHTVGGHGWDHTDVRGLSGTQIAARLRLEADAWWDVARVTPVPYFRPPYGELDAEAVTAIGREGFAAIVLWDVDPWDWSGPGSDAVAARVLAHARAGSIVVLHALPGTATALPGLIDRLRAKGLEPVSLTEMLGD